MSSLPQDIRDKMMNILKIEEDKTDLENLAVLSRVGMKVASSTTSELDADSTSASSTALIDLGLRLSEATAHGALTEIILHNAFGYSILQAVNDDFIVFGGLKNVFRIGYYLGYLRELAKKLNRLISGDEITEMTLSLDASEKAKLGVPDDDEDATPIKPSVEQDKAALDDLLGFLDDWEKEGGEETELESQDANNIVSIPKSRGMDYEMQAIPDQPSTQTVEKVSETFSQFKVYDDEIPPVPLDDYTPMEIEEDATVEEPQIIQQPAPILSPNELPALDELTPPDFESDMFNSASEYDTEFVLDKESEAFDSILKDLGWDEEED